MLQGGKIKLGFSFCKRRFPNCKGGAVLLLRAKNKGIFGGNRFLQTDTCPPLFFSFSIFSLFFRFFEKLTVFFLISDFGLVAVCFHLALGSPSVPGQCVPLFFGKANAKLVWSDGGVEGGLALGRQVCQDGAFLHLLAESQNGKKNSGPSFALD